MSFCPTKDIFSVYLDGEMPERYKTEFESHLNSCPKCSAEFARLRKIRDMLRADSEETTLSKEYLAQSFDRLELKLRYSRHTASTRPEKKIPYKFYVPVAAAAAAVLALVIPLRTNAPATSGAPAAVASVVSHVPSANNVSLGSGRTKVISGNIHESVLSAEDDGSKMTRGVGDSVIKDVDVFRPDFDDDKTISIKITIPGMNSVPYMTEIQMPVNVIMGQFE